MITLYYVGIIMKNTFKDDSNYGSIAKLSIISLTALVMIFAVPASFVSNNHYYHLVYAAAKNTSPPSKSGGDSTSTTKKTKSAATGILKINGFVKRSDCSDLISPRCPEVSDSYAWVSGRSPDNPDYYWPWYYDGPFSNQPKEISIPVGAPYAVRVHTPIDHFGFWKWEAGYISGSCTGRNLCTGTMTANGATITVNLNWACVSSPFGRC
jgi:hypothetical protein